MKTPPAPRFELPEPPKASPGGAPYHEAFQHNAFYFKRVLIPGKREYEILGAERETVAKASQVQPHLAALIPKLWMLVGILLGLILFRPAVLKIGGGWDLAGWTAGLVALAICTLFGWLLGQLLRSPPEFVVQEEEPGRILLRIRKARIASPRNTIAEVEVPGGKVVGHVSRDRMDAILFSRWQVESAETSRLEGLAEEKAALPRFLRGFAGGFGKVSFRLIHPRSRQEIGRLIPIKEWPHWHRLELHGDAEGLLDRRLVLALALVIIAEGKG